VAAVAAMVGVCAGTDRVQADGPDKLPNYLLFAGTDLWRYALFLYGGMLWSPAGLNSGGFTLKLLLDGGNYTYKSGPGSDIGATLWSAAALPGWRFWHDGLIVSLFAGPIAQDYRLVPNDPGSRLHGAYAGGQVAAEIWYQPSPATMASLNGEITSIGPTGSVRAAAGVRIFDRAFVGPEVKDIWCCGAGSGYQELQLGLHVTALRIDTLEWSMAGGWGLDSDRRDGPYFRLGMNARY